MHLIDVNKLLFRLWRTGERLRRMPRSRGFGIQSPWAYRFVRTVAMGREGRWQALPFEQRLKGFMPTCHLQYAQATDAERLRKLLDQATEQTVVRVEGIHRAREARENWERLAANDHVGVSFDCLDFGLLFFNKKMHQRTYRINHRQ